MGLVLTDFAGNGLSYKTPGMSLLLGASYPGVPHEEIPLPSVSILFLEKVI